MATTRKFAEGTETSVSSSQAEIGRIVERYGCTGFTMGWEGERAGVSFTAHGRQVRFVIDLGVTDTDVVRSPHGRSRTPAQRENAKKAEVRRRWRALTLAIKAKLEVVESEIATFEEEFMAHIVLPDGRTFGEHATPAIERAYADGGLPQLSIGGGQ